MKKYSRYKFKSGSKVIKGLKPNFFNFLLDNVDRNKIILDLGCGSGELTLQLSPYCQKIIGLDNFPEYIKTARGDKKINK